MKAAIGWLIGFVFVVCAWAEPLLEGRVRLESGEPVADAQVRIFDMTDLERGAIARAQTDGTGYFALPLAALGGSALPEGFALGPNYPNPFNPSTIIPYQLAASAEVRLEVFNLLGQHLATLVDGERPAGFHTATWHATDAAGRAVGAGVYIYRMTVGVASQTGRMVLIDGQAGVAAAGAASVWSGVSGGSGSDGTGEQLYGLIVSGEGLAPYVDSAFRVEAGMTPVELVVSAGHHSAGKVTDDDCPLCDFFDAFNEAAKEKAEEEAEEEEEGEEDDETPEEERADGQVSIPDANLRSGIEHALGKASAAPITQADMATLDTIDDPSFWGQGISDLTGLEYAINLTYLDIFDNNISDISPLAGLTQLETLYLSRNKIVDISPLAGLTKLVNVDLRRNRIRDLTPLAGLTNLSHVAVNRNPLNAASIDKHIPALQAKNVTVRFDVFVDVTDPQIYNDNVFVLPVTENLASGLGLWSLPLKDYASRFYEHFNDEFDFLIFVPSLLIGEQEHGGLDGMFFRLVNNNDVSGIGDPSTIANYLEDGWGFTRKLQGVIGNFTYISSPYSDFRNGTLLHEFLHRWANWIISPFGHWGFSTSGGLLDCWNITNIIDHGNGKYSLQAISSPHYSPLELYLAGFIPAEEVPDWRVAENAEWLYDERGRIVEDDNGYRMFTATGFKTYTIEDIIAEHGPRVPDHSQAQKDFRAAVILLVSEDYPATQEMLKSVSDDVSWISYPGEDQSYPSSRSNFYEGTGGRGTIIMDGLSQFERR